MPPPSLSGFNYGQVWLDHSQVLLSHHHSLWSMLSMYLWAIELTLQCDGVLAHR